MDEAYPRLYVESSGQGEHVVLVHGWGMHSGFWREFADLLRHNYRVSCVDLPGHGRSAMIDEFNLPVVAQTLADQITGCAHWIGWSLGASIVLRLAADYPERVNSVGLIAGNPKFNKAKDWLVGMDGQVLDQFYDNLKRDYRKTLQRFLKLQTRGMANPKSMYGRLRDRLDESAVPHPDALSCGVNILKFADLRSILATIQHPILVVLGTEDSLVPVAVGPAMKSLSPAICLSIIEQAGHIPFISHVTETFDVVSSFLQRQSVV